MSAGTEVSFQNVAKHLTKNFIVDYFYCDSAPYVGSDWVHPDTDPYRKKFMESSKVNLIKFKVEKKDITNVYHEWINTDFWEKFDEKDYSLIFSTTAGSPEYPFHLIKNTPIVNIVTINAGVNNQDNIHKTVLISEDSLKVWLNQGGNNEKYDVIPLCREEIPKNKNNFRDQIGLGLNFVFGMHQREDDTIFSEVPLKAYKRIQTSKNFFLILGGSKKYSDQAKKLNLKNFKQLPSSADSKIIGKFLNTLDVYTHGRKHGETMGLVLTEAMSYGLPIISHRAESNAQVEVIGNAGRVFYKRNIFSYSGEMKRLENNSEYYNLKSKNSLDRFNSFYSLSYILDKYDRIIKEVKL